MNNFRSQEAVHNVDSLRELIDPTLGILERHRTNSYSPQVFTFEIPIALQDIDRYLSRVKDCIEHRPAPLQQGFSIEEANTVVKLAEGCKHSLHRVQNDIPNLNDPAHHRRLVDEGYDILSHLRGQAQKLVTFYNNLERTVREARTFPQRPPRPARPDQGWDAFVEALRRAFPNLQASNGTPTYSTMAPPQPDLKSLREEYERGVKEGRAQGHELGHAQGYERGFREGQAKGYRDGDIQGHKAGYDEGYAAALEYACTRFVVMGGLDHQREPTPTMWAIHHRSLDDIKLLRKMDTNFNQLSLPVGSGIGSPRLTPLRAAIERNDTAIVNLLLNFNVHMEFADPDGSNALLAAASEGKEEIVHLLFEHGAEELLRHHYKGGSLCGYSPLSVAVYHGHLPVVKLLHGKMLLTQTRHPSDEQVLHLASKRGHFSIVNYLLDEKYDVNRTDENKQTPLHAAISAGCTHILQLLLSQGAHTEVFDQNERTPMQLAIDRASAADEEQFCDAITTLIDNGAQIEHTDNRYSALVYAARLGRVFCVRLLLGKKADPNYIPHRRTRMKPALHEAIKKNNLTITKILLEHGGKLSIKNELCSCPVQVGIENGNQKMLEVLLKQEEHLFLLSNWSCTGYGLVRLAIENGQVDLIPFLLDNGADIEFSSTNDELSEFRPLHSAVMLLNHEAVCILLERGADPCSKTKTGECAKCIEVNGSSDGLYARCLLENQREQVENDSNSRMKLREIDELIRKKAKEIGAAKVPKHVKNSNRRNNGLFRR